MVTEIQKPLTNDIAHALKQLLKVHYKTDTLTVIKKTQRHVPYLDRYRQYGGTSNRLESRKTH